MRYMRAAGSYRALTLTRLAIFDSDYLSRGSLTVRPRILSRELDLENAQLFNRLGWLKLFQFPRMVSKVSYVLLPGQMPHVPWVGILLYLKSRREYLSDGLWFST